MKDSPCRMLLPLLAALTLSGCVSSGTAAPPEARSPADPWEPMNRRIDAFNRTLDKVTLKPVAKGYQAILPAFARRGISNFYDNLLEPRTAINNLLQGKPRAAFGDLVRFLMNSSLGLLGILDIGTELGLEQHDEDFGQTFAVWGAGDGPYVVIPFFGPHTLRDALLRPLDMASNPLYFYRNRSVRDKLTVLQVIDLRERLLRAEGFLEDSTDPYITIRESYLQNREYNVYDGDPPMDDDFYDEFLDEEE